MSKQLIERLRGFKDTPRTADNLCHEAADRIEELERANQHLIMALADAEALEIGTAERCDALQADNARLRDALEDSYMTNPCDTHSQQAAFDKAQSALFATPEQSITEYRNKVIEAFVNEFSRHVGGDGEFWLHELQDFAMKEQP